MDNNGYLNTLATLMKKGRQAEVQHFFDQASTEAETETFVSYMERLVAKSGMSRAKIADRVGLSRDYIYKVLRGAKRTTERDYILAVCISMGASLLETQRALELYPFPVLDCADMRSAIIMSAINERVSCLTLNNWLDSMKLPMLKVSPDMPSAKVGPVRSKLSSRRVTSEEAGENRPSKRRTFANVKKTNTYVSAEYVGNAPFDFFYIAEYELTDDAGKKVYAQACFWPGGKTKYGIVTRSVAASEDAGEMRAIEQYDTLEEASASQYFPYFLELDRLTDEKTAQTMNFVNDTKYFGFRLGGRVEKEGFMMYSEAYNSEQPELNEYLQVRQTPDGMVYSASHKSDYMKIELRGMDAIYEMYFGKLEKSLYLFEIHSLEELGEEYSYLKSSFESMVMMMRDWKGKQEEESRSQEHDSDNSVTGIAIMPEGVDLVIPEGCEDISFGPIHKAGRWGREVR